MNDKQQIEAQLYELRKQLNAINEREAHERNKELLGKCFKCRNNYGGSEPREQWWLYQRVEKVSGNEITTFQFEVDYRGHIEIDPKRIEHGGVISMSVEIKPSEFNRAWKAVQKKLAALQ